MIVNALGLEIGVIIFPGKFNMIYEFTLDVKTRSNHSLLIIIL